MANVSYLRTPGGERVTGKTRSGLGSSSRGPRRGAWIAGGVVLFALAAAAVAAFIFASASASLTTDSTALAKVGLPLGGGSIQSITVVGGKTNTPIPVTVRGDRIWPTKLVPANEAVTVYVVVKRPGWISWLAGSTQRLKLSLTTPVASLRSHYITVSGHAPVALRFKSPVSEFAYGPSHHLRRRLLAQPQTVVRLPRTTPAGTVYVQAAPRTWETSKQAAVSWFPATGAATAVASPAPGTKIKSDTPITLTFSKPVAKAVGSHLPPVSPNTQGSWHQLNSHAMVFRPEGYGYGLGANVTIPLPNGVRVVGQTGANATWNVPAGSTTRLQQMLALLGYLPQRFKYDGPGVGLTYADQEAAAIKPPAGRFVWRWSSTPGWLKSDWQPGSFGEITKGALMAFENNNGMTADGLAGPQVWKALMNAVIHDQKYSFGYTVVDVSEGSPESESTWHNGKTVASGPVNTGIPATPTATGTFAVFEHAPSVTMSGTNADGSHYVDPGIPDVSYFNGGDALHGFIRGSYGYPQSDGCVEMPYSEAASVYPYTPIGTIVHVT
ncbi:MAG: L,D-transpeptidase family protein [Solirubrobacteraceae bacterium]